MKDLKGRTVRAGFAKLCAQGITFVLRLGALMVLARLLDPQDFGLVAMVTVVAGFFEKLRDAGLSVVTIQRAAISEEEVSTLFWINMMVGATLGVLLSAIAPVLSFFYNEPRLVWVTVGLAAGFLFNAAGVQHSALLQREMRFVTLSGVEILSLALSTAVGIAMAIGGYKYWALVVMAVVMPASTTIGVWLATMWVPGRPHWGAGVSSMIRFGGTTTLNILVVDVAFNLEKLILGRFFGAEALGIYGRAYQLVKIPTDSLNSAIGGVVFSALSRLQNDHDRFKNYFLKGYSLVLAMTVPVTVACALFADDIILVILGPQWKDAIPIFRLLTPTILIFALIMPMGWLMYSLGLAGRSLKISLVIAPLVLAACILGLPYGPSGVALAYSVAMILWVIPHLAWCINGTMISLRDLLEVVHRPLLSAIAAAAIAFAAQFVFGQWLSPFLRLVLGGSILALSYLWMLFYVMGQKAFYLDLLGGLKRTSAGNESGKDIGTSILSTLRKPA